MNLLLAKLVDDLTLKFMPFKELVDYAKHSLGNTNPTARNAGGTLLKAIYKQYGPKLNDMLQDVKPQTLKTIQAEFEKIIVVEEIECKVEFRGEAQEEAKGMTNDKIDDALPRADISKEIAKI